MAVYVDQITDYGGRLGGHVGRVSQQWCHLYADSLTELHDFAARIGMQRAWFQEGPTHFRCHYDLTPARRAEAVRLGAIEVRRLEFWRELRRQGRDRLPPQP